MRYKSKEHPLQVVDANLQPESGQVRAMVPVVPDQEVQIAIAYQSRGADAWSYSPSKEVAALNNFTLSMTTDFQDIDFPSYTLSPSSKSSTSDGWALTWVFDRVVTGHGVACHSLCRGHGF